MTREDLNPLQVDPWPGQAEGPARRAVGQSGNGCNTGAQGLTLATFEEVHFVHSEAGLKVSWLIHPSKT